MSVPRHHLTIEDYLSRERTATVKHEFVSGQLFAMTGTTLRHNVIVNNVVKLLNHHLNGGTCRVYFCDVKVRAEATNGVYYPDVVVSCSAFAAESLFAANPVFIAEVISPSTKTIDTREKSAAYQTIDSVQEYLIVHQKKIKLQLIRRIDGVRWETLTFGPGSTVVLSSLPEGTLQFPIDAVYDTLDYPEPNLTVEEEAEEYEVDEADGDW